MNIFEKRPLSLILCITLCGFFLFTLENELLRRSLIILPIIALVISFVIKISKEKKILIRISSLVLLLSLLLSHLYFDLYFKLYDRYNEQVEVVGMVEEITLSNSYTNRLLIKVEEINGKKANGYKVYAYPTKTESKGIVEGTRISFKTLFGGFSDESKQYNFANGINAYANDIKDIEILEYTDGGISGKLKYYREYLTRYIISKTDSEAGSLISALLIGQRDYLPDKLRLDFRRIGISHILALSGMHLALISLAIGNLLSLCGVKKKQRLIIISAFVLLYMALTGFSPSVCRAGIMLIISSLLFLLGYQKDSFTSLTIAVTIICIISPNSIYDISLWLSALATLGIIAFAEYSRNNKKSDVKSGQIAKYIKLSILTSIFAISSTIAISTFSFGGFSIIAPIATLIFSIIAEIIMYLGGIVLLIGWLFPIGFIVRPFSALLYKLSDLISDIDIAYVSSNFKLTRVAIILYTVIFFLFIVLKVKDQKTWMNGIVISFICLTIIPTYSTVAAKNQETISYTSAYRTDCIMVRSEGQVCLINSSQYSKNTAYDALELLEDANVTVLNKYYLTHYSWSIDDDIETLLYNIKVEEICLPEPRNNDEISMLKIAQNSVKDSNARITTYKEFDRVIVGEYSIILLYSAPYGETSVNALVIANDSNVITYLSSGILTEENREVYDKYLSISDYVILGEHGKKYKSRIYLDSCKDDVSTIVVHSENILFYEEDSNRYIENGCVIYPHPEGIIYLIE